MLGFTYYTPTKVAFGKGSVERVGELMKQFGGTRVLIHYGGQSAVRSGVLDRVKKSLDEAGIFHVELGGVVPNPHLAKVREGIELSKANGVDFLLAVRSSTPARPSLTAWLSRSMMSGSCTRASARPKPASRLHPC